MSIPELPLIELCRFSNFFDKLPHKYGAWNSGMVFDNNSFLFSCRNETSRFNSSYFGRETPREFRWQRSVPALIRLDIDGNFISARDSITVPNESLEDVRLFKLHNEIFLTGTKRVVKGADQFLAKLVDNVAYMLPLNHEHKPNQKNWTAITYNNELFFEQSISKPRRVYKYSLGNLELIDQYSLDIDLRGNCPPIPFGNDLLAIYHTYTGPHGYFHRIYVQYAAILEKNPPFKIKKIFGPFRFNIGNENRIQFHTGLETLGDDLFFSFGIEDSDNIFAKINTQSFRSFIEHIGQTGS